jgi:hypothetical protein
MAPGILLLTGAPESSSLDWNHPGLLDTFSAPFSRFAGLDAGGDVVPATPAPATASTEYPSWRSIPLERQHLATGHSQDHGWQEEYQGTSFFTTSAIGSFVEEWSPGAGQTSSFESTAEQALSQFYEQSYERHEDVVPSQIAAASDVGTSFYSIDTSFDATESFFDSPLRPVHGARDIPIAGHLSLLKDIPNASYLNSIHPQTMTVNLIIGIISILPPRAIRTRRGADVELVEILVGDETKSGFGVNFWLPPSSQSAHGSMRNALNGLRPQDVVLMRNVALSSFRGKVYGQSLRGEMTKVHLMYRNRINRTDLGGCYNAADLVSDENLNPQVERTARVKEWVLKFVGVGDGRRKAKGRVSAVMKETLPPDTQ